MNAAGPAPTGLKVLFFLRGMAYVVIFESLLRAMLERGHDVRVALDHEKADLNQDGASVLEALRDNHADFAYQQLPRRKDLWRIPASAIRRSLDYLRYLEPEHSDAAALRDGARERSPRALRALLFLPPFRWPAGRRPLAWLLRRLEAGMPIPRRIKSLIRDQAPDVAAVSPLLEPGSMQGDYIRSAEAAGVPTVFVVASLDDLTAKSVIRDVPTLTVVRDQAQVEDAVHVQGLRRDRIEAVGVRSNGTDASLGADAVEAIERAAPGEVTRRRQGRFLRPLLWLLTPLLAIVLPFVRPLTTARAVVRAVRRLAAWARKRGRALRRKVRDGRARRRKARVGAAKERKIAQAEAAKEEKQARAEAKEQKVTEAEAARRQKAARAVAPGEQPAAGDDEPANATETRGE